MDISLENASITADGVRAAAARLKGKAVRTPLLESQTLNDIVGGRVLLKAEMLQHYGSFKCRGAYNLISQLTEEERRRGILAWSSGNHAQGVAFAARMAGAQATIIMPADAPAIKTENVKALGADIIFYDRYSEDREATAPPANQERPFAEAFRAGGTIRPVAVEATRAGVEGAEEDIAQDDSKTRRRREFTPLAPSSVKAQVLWARSALALRSAPPGLQVSERSSLLCLPRREAHFAPRT